MSITYPDVARALHLPQPGAWLARRHARRLQRQAARELAELPPYLLRDVGLVDLHRAHEDQGGRSLDHTRPVCTALSSWQW